MSDEMKPREFWVDDILNVDRPSEKTAYIHSQDADDKATRPIHVIEKSAYDALARKLEIAKRALNDICWSWYNDAGRQCCDLAEDALKEIEKSDT